MSSAERVMGKITARPGERILGWLALAALAATAIMSLVVSPSDAEQGQLVRLMYVHVPAAWLAYLAFAVVFVSSIAYLKTKKTRWDRMAAASAEVGVLFTGLMLVVGSLWGRPTWGTWWEWDARLTSTAILFFLYLGYLALRRTGATADERGNRCAIAALIAAADMPIVHFSVSWWQTLHQEGTVFNDKLDVKVNGSMALTLLLAVAAFTMLYGSLVLQRFQLAQLEEGREERALQRAIEERVRADEVVVV